MKGSGVRITASGGSADSDAGAIDQFDVGGVRGSIEPGEPLSGRVYSAALPVGTLAGDQFTDLRAEFVMGQMSPVLFYERIETSNANVNDSIELAGIEWTMSTESLPIAKLPALDVTAGIAYVVDGPMKADTKAWLALA